ncbi:MAG: DUF3667 domain-containing protein [Bacteroidota bacterium]
MKDTKPAIVPKGRYQLKYRGTECTNCGHPLDMSDRYCPNCSQANSTKKLTLKDFFDEFFSSLISYDSKLLKTLSALLIRPGKITADYVAGKRVSYTNPFRFLLSLAIVYFLMLNFNGNFGELDRFGMGQKDNPISMGGAKGFHLEIQDKETEQGLKMLDSIGFYESLNQTIDKRDSLILDDPSEYFNTFKNTSFWERLSIKQDFFNTLLRKDSVYTFGELSKKYNIEKTYENRTSFNAAKSFLKVSQQPGSFASELISKLPFVIFFFLPVFAVFIWLVYIRKKYTYTDHLIFSFHNQSLLFILLIISFLIDIVFPVDTGGIFLLIFSIYLYKSMRKFYEQGRFKTIVKYMFLNIIFFILATVSAVLLLTGSIFTY